VADIREIVECDRVTGEDCFVAKVFVPRVDDLERVIDRLLPFAQTNTSIIQSRRFGEDSRRCAASGTLPVRQSAPPLRKTAP
jgi:DNA-binding Lrp family transcriptional regulator